MMDCHYLNWDDVPTPRTHGTDSEMSVCLSEATNGVMHPRDRYTEERVLVPEIMKWHNPERDERRASFDGILDQNILVYMLWWYGSMCIIPIYFSWNISIYFPIVHWKSALCLRQKQVRGEPREKQSPLNNLVTKRLFPSWVRHPG